MVAEPVESACWFFGNQVVHSEEELSGFFEGLAEWSAGSGDFVWDVSIQVDFVYGKAADSCGEPPSFAYLWANSAAPLSFKIFLEQFAHPKA